MCSTELKDFVNNAVNLRNKGSISESTFKSMIIGASSLIVNQKVSNDFNLYVSKKLDYHFNNSLRHALRF